MVRFTTLRVEKRMIANWVSMGKFKGKRICWHFTIGQNRDIWTNHVNNFITHLQTLTSMIQILSAIATACIIITFTILLSKHFSARLIAATVLCSIAFIYVGFSLKNNTASSIILEVLVAIAFYIIAIIGYSKYNLLLAYGIVLHGIWDIAHHNALLIKTDIPLYWPAYCLVTDVILGIYFFVVFKTQK